MSYQQDKFKEIADKLREYTATSEPIAPKDFALKIDDVAMVQYQKGKSEGGETLPDADVMEFPLAEISIGRVSTDSEYYTEIAQAIAALGEYNSCKPSEMVYGIESVKKRQYLTGLSDGRADLETELLGGAW